MADHNDIGSGFLSDEQNADLAGLSARIRIQERFSTNPINWYAWIFSKLRLPPHASILELGCGPGDLWFENLNRLHRSWRVFISDLSESMVVEARWRLPPEVAGFDFAIVDAQAIPSLESRFDAVIGNGLLDRVPQRGQALNEIQRVLKTNARFYTTTGGRTHLHEIESLVRPFLPDADYGGDPHRFGIHNGAKILSPWFADIKRYLYEDELVFDQVTPVITYALSEKEVARALSGDKLESFGAYVEDRLSAQGEIRVTSKKALFIATKSD